MNRNYVIQFLFGKLNPRYKNVFNTSSHLKKRKKSCIFPFGIRDALNFIQGINKSDIFISSFLYSKITFWGILIARILNKKIVIWEERWLFLTSDFRSRIKSYCSKFLSKYVHSFFVMGEYQKKALTGLGVIPDKIFVASECTGIDYGLAHQKKVDYIIPGKKNILYLGRFIYLKGIEYIIDAFNIIEKEYECNDFILNIIGYGPLEIALKEKVRALDLNNVHIYPPIFNVDEKSYIFNNSYMAIISSIIDENGNAEGGPMVVLEYISAGLPILATTAIGHYYFFKKYKIGSLVGQRSAYAIADGIIKLDNMISNKEISKDSIRKEFLRLPGFNYQYMILNKAISAAIKNNKKHFIL
jgi:glycosyltransferase involved in cell wall biosynthesis